MARLTRNSWIALQTNQDMPLSFPVSSLRNEWLIPCMGGDGVFRVRGLRCGHVSAVTEALPPRPGVGAARSGHGDVCAHGRDPAQGLCDQLDLRRAEGARARLDPERDPGVGGSGLLLMMLEGKALPAS